MSETEALEQSIKKWEDIVAGEGKDLGPDNCALCKKYYKMACWGCPVRAHTGETCCEDTPYDNWNTFIEDYHLQEKSINEMPEELRRIAKDLAQKELDFLKKLRKET